jgi:CRP-like cAMP-binding protein
VPTRLELEIGASYMCTPAAVKTALTDAFEQVPRVLRSPAPDALVWGFEDSAVTYRARFWIDDFEWDDEVRDEVRTAIYYAFGRHGIEIPYHIEVGYEREWPDPGPAAKQKQREEILAGVELFSRLSDEQRQEIAAGTEIRTFGDGEAIVRQNASGQSMFVVCSGRVAVVLEPERREVATIEKGGYFGEMSVLSGEPRSATVVARGDAAVLELDADLFRKLGASDPAAIEDIAVAAMTRRIELNEIRESAASTAVAEAPATFVSRMRRFLRL